MKKLILFTLFSLPLFATLPSTLQVEVRTTGSDNNGGAFDPSVASPGTDYSQQDSAQIAYTDLVISATTTNYTSVAHAVTSAVVGNTIQIISGTNCTVGFYNIRSETGGSPNFATVDRSMGTATSVCTANLGGGLLTIAKAAAAIVAYNTIWIKAGTYTLTTVIAPQVLNYQMYQGYNSTHGDNGTRPLITTSTNSTDLFHPSGSSTFSHIVIFQNISFSNTAATVPFGGIAIISGNDTVIVNHCLFDFPTVTTNQGNGIYNNNGSSLIQVYNSEFKGSGNGIEDNGGNNSRLFVYNNYFHNTLNCVWWNAGNALTLNSWLFEHNTFNGCNYAIYLNGFGGEQQDTYIKNNSFYNIAKDAIFIFGSAGTAAPLSIWNNAFWLVAGLPINLYADGGQVMLPLYTSPNAYGYNTSQITSGATTSSAGGTVTGSAAQTCNFTITGAGALAPLGSAATGTVALTGTNTINSSTLTIVSGGYGYLPALSYTQIALTSGTATCSSTATITSVLGAQTSHYINYAVTNGTGQYTFVAGAGGTSGDVSLTGNPFNNAGSGDFSLNSTAGAGAALKAVGFPGAAPGGTGYIDIGALQSQVVATSSSSAYVQ